MDGLACLQLAQQNTILVLELIKSYVCMGLCAIGPIHIPPGAAGTT